jgi:valyl-tRNA synthetase
MLEKTIDNAEIEARHYQDWEKSGAFAAHPESNAKPFAIMMPPPNVTGSLHMGHAFTMTLQDILTRYRRMKGDDALWMPGTDHAGIATQMVVERQLESEGLKRRELGREQFLNRVWKWKEYSGGTITSQLRRLGTTPDWARERFTMDEGLSRAVLKVFVQLYKEGLIYKDKRLVNWDPKLCTAVSDLEVEMIEKKGHLWHIQYAVEGAEARTITVATTRPETLLGDTAIAVHPDDERYKDLVGKMAAVPICGRLIPIIADEYADPEKGSGAVKITPAHDFNDFEVGKRHKLPMINIFDDRAHLNENVPEEYQGLERFEARKKILAELEAQEILEKVENITHAVPFDEKSKSVIIEPYLTDQWYVNAAVLAKPVAEAVRSGKTEIIPKNWEKLFFDWIENIQPWCISRQLWWGHQIPAWYDADGKVYVAESEEEAQAQAGPDAVLTRDPDVLDTWFSSALWPFSTLGWPDKTPELNKYYPGSVLITGFDILFFWVIRMMMMGIHFMGDVPFKKVYLHALVLDAKGQKMSKSKGNVIDPLTLIEKYGADALRFSMAIMAAQGRDIKMSEDRVENSRNFATKLWNAARYCEMNGCLPDGAFDPSTVKNPINLYMIDAVISAERELSKNLDEYRFNMASQTVYNLVWSEFCDWYLEFTKPLLNVILSDSEGSRDSSPAAQNDIVKETKATTAWALEQILRLLNPFMPFVTEELYEKLGNGKGERIFSTDWPDYSALSYSKDFKAQIGWLKDMITTIRSVRSDMNVPASARIDVLLKDAGAETKSWAELYEAVLKQMARLNSVKIADGNIPARSLKTVVREATVILPVADLIDLDKERERLKKQIAKLEDDVRKTDEKLGNEQFVANAPDEIVEEFKARKTEALQTVSKLATALRQLEE